MVKKKRQSDPSENGDESTESCDENVKTQSQCPHVGKAVDLTRLKKSLKAGGFDKDCSECLKITKNEVSDPDFEEDLSLWMCLRCGTQLCGRARNKHALNHYNTPHSDCHSLTTNTTTWDIYCYNCNNEVAASSSKKLHECVEYLKKQALSNVNKSLPPIELPYENKSKIDLILPVENCVTSEKGKDKANSLNLPRVRGLSNLGNTCFFNSVMQCLAQTPYLVQVLQEMSEPGEKFTLPGGKLKLKTDNNETKEVELPEIVGQLAEWGTLTRTLAVTLTDLQSGEGGVYTPRFLLSSLVNKLPQFGGGDQHDAHELLRHLLEAVRSEDLRRYQSVILSSLGMSSKVDPAKVDGEVKQKVKFYGQQASDTMLRPEQVFRGFLVSTLECQECFHQSHRAEYFLDLSLPVAACRPQPPALVRRKPANEDNLYNNQDEHKPSKHQLRKERNAARKGARKNKGSSAKGEKSTEETNGPAKEDGKSSSESDADVEDNVEEAPRTDVHAGALAAAPPHQQGGHLDGTFAPYYRTQYESGYNSDKVVSTDSIQPSPDLDKEKTDNTPECADKDKIDFADPSTSAIPLDYKPLASLENMSNPDSGVASPETTKHNSTETVDNVDSPINGKELGSRSSLSSEANLELASPQRKLSPEQEPPPPEPERPASRRDFAAEPYSNEVVARGISAQGCRSLLEGSAEAAAGYDSHADSSKEEVRTLLNDYYSRLKLAMCDLKPSSPSSPEGADGGAAAGGPTLGGPPLGGATLGGGLGGPAPPRPPPAQTPRYLCDEDECSIHSCLSQFTALELLTGNNKVGCESCTERLNGEGGKTVYTNATKRFLVSSPPAILILHLKRFQLGPRCMFRKMSKHVEFPTILDLAPFCAMDKVRELPNVGKGQTRLLYSLYGVVEHSGGMHGGHYVAYVKVRPAVKAGDPRWRFLPRSANAAAGDAAAAAAAAADAADDSESSLSGYESGEAPAGAGGAAAAGAGAAPAGRWYYVSDSMVSEVTEEKVLRAQAYLLFYERIL